MNLQELLELFMVEPTKSYGEEEMYLKFKIINLNGDTLCKETSDFDDLTKHEWMMGITVHKILPYIISWSITPWRDDVIGSAGLLGAEVGIAIILETERRH